MIDVLFLPKWYPSRIEPFDGNFIENHAHAIKKHANISVLFVHSDQLSNQQFELIVNENNGIKECRVFFQKAATPFGFINKVINYFRYKKAQKIGFQKLYPNHQPDLCHVHVIGRSSILAYLLKRRFKIPYLITEHWSGYTQERNEFKGALKKMFYRFIAQHSEGISCVSKYLQKSMAKHNIKAKYSIVSNVVDTELFYPQKTTKNHDQTIKIGHISNLSRQPKNMHLIIEALNEVGKNRTDFEFILIGTGPDEKEMLELLDASSIKDRYRFYGEIELSEVSELMKNLDFLIIYSQYETQSVVLLESIACGVPVLASNVGGMPEYLPAEYGLLIAPNKVKSLISGIEKMLERYMNYDTSEMHNYVKNRFSAEEIGKQFIELYRGILNKQGDS